MGGWEDGQWHAADGFARPRFAEVLPSMLKLPMGFELPESRIRYFWSEESDWKPRFAVLRMATGHTKQFQKKIIGMTKKCHHFVKSCLVVFFFEF